jgi:hypothetical protein
MLLEEDHRHTGMVTGIRGWICSGELIKGRGSASSPRIKCSKLPLSTI